jgi:hypothetical protein
LLNGIKDLKTVKSGNLKIKKQTVATEKHVAAAIVQNPLKANGSLPAPTKRCFARISDTGSLPPIIIKNRFFSRQGGVLAHAIISSSGNISARWQIMVCRRIRHP